MNQQQAADEEWKRDTSLDTLLKTAMQRFQDHMSDNYMPKWSDPYWHEHPYPYRNKHTGETCDYTRLPLVVRVLEEVRKGHQGFLVATDLRRFRAALWADFIAWCPQGALLYGERRYLDQGYIPHGNFILDVVTGGMLFCGSVEHREWFEGKRAHFAASYDVIRASNGGDVIDHALRLVGHDGSLPRWLPGF